MMTGDIRELLEESDRSQQLQKLDQWVKKTASSATALTTLFRELIRQPQARKLAFEFVARLPEPMPPLLVLHVSQYLHHGEIPLGLRMTVAGKLLDQLPDEEKDIGPILRALTAQNSKSQRLERLIQLQSRVRSGRALDRLVALEQQRVKLQCPRCAELFDRSALIRHLWYRHQLIFDRGTARDPRLLVEKELDAFLQSREGEDLDRVYEVTELIYPQATRLQILQSILARHPVARQRTELPEQLARDETGQVVSACGHCLHRLPELTPRLPLPLNLSTGRLSGEGYLVEVLDRWGGRQAWLTTPRETRQSLAVPWTLRWDRRTQATWWSLPLFLLALILAVFVSGPGLLGVLGLLAGGGLTYAWVLARRSPRLQAQDHAVDLFWSEVVPRVSRSTKALRLLVRLCLLDSEHGVRATRRAQVWELEEEATDSATPTSDLHLQWRIVTQLFQSFDKQDDPDLLALAEIIMPFWRGEMSPVALATFAEVLQLPGRLTTSDQGALAHLLKADAFSHDWKPRDLIDLGDIVPSFGRLMQQSSPSDWGWDYAAFQALSSRPWTRWQGNVRSLRSLIEEDEEVAAILGDYPDTLFQIETDPAVTKALGPILFCRQGVIVADFQLTDPRTQLHVEKLQGGIWVLAIGNQRVIIDRKLPTAFPELLSSWIQFYQQTQRKIPSLLEIPGKRCRHVMRDSWQACPLCDTPNITRPGKKGLLQF